MRVVVALIALLAFAPARADEPATPPAPPPVGVKVTAEPSTVTIGQRFRLKVELRVQPGYEVVFAQPAEKIDDFDVIDFGELPRETRGADTLITRWFTLAGFETGQKVLNAPSVKYRRPGGELADAPVDHTLVTVESVLAKDPKATDVHEIRGPLAAPIDWRPYQAAALGLAVLGALGALVWWWRRRRQQLAVVPPPRPPHEVAREAFLALKQRGLIERGEFKDYYSALTSIVRVYLEGRFKLRAPEMTTEEFLQATARGGQLERQHRQLLGEFMSESDLVKFAKHVPTLDDAARGLTAAERFVDETTPRPETPEGSRAAG